MQTIGGIEKSCVRRNENLRSEIRALEALWQRGNSLLRRQGSGCGVIVERDQCGSLFLQRVKPAAVRMKSEMAGTIAGRQRHARLRSGRKLAGVYIKLPNEDLIQSQIAREDELAC